MSLQALKHWHKGNKCQTLVTVHADMPNDHICKAWGYSNLFSAHNTVTSFVLVTAAPAPISSPASLCVFVYVSFSDADISHLSTSQPQCVVSLVPDAPHSWRSCSLLWLNLISYTNSQCVWRFLADKRENTMHIYLSETNVFFSVAIKRGSLCYLAGNGWIISRGCESR